MQCPSSQFVHQVLEDDCKKSSIEVCGEKIFFYPFRICLQQADNLFSYCCLLLVPINVLRHLGASVSKYRCLRQLLNRPVPSIRLGFRFLSLAGYFLPISISIFGRELLILGVQQLEDIYRIMSMNLCAWLNLLGMETNDASAKRRRTR